MAVHAIKELSNEELERIESRSAAATMGPWLSNPAEADSAADSSVIELGSCNELGTFRTIALIGATAEDHDFIVHARQDVPRLLNEVRCLRALLHSISGQVDDFGAHTMRIAGEDAVLMSSAM